MAVMHPRVAHNYLKNGYYPTDEETLRRLAHILEFKSGEHCLLDPCCGEGSALNQLVNESNIEPDAILDTYGIELDAERAKKASGVLNHVLKSNTFDTVVGARSQSLLFLNPPYGDIVTDQIEKQDKGLSRLEIQFLRRVFPTLKRKGVLVLVVPYPSLTKPFTHYLSTHLEGVSVYQAETNRFKQVVIIGYKTNMTGEVHRIEREKTANLLYNTGKGEHIPSRIMMQTLYQVTPISPTPFRFETVTPDKALLEATFQLHSGLWPSFSMSFEQDKRQWVPQPLRRLSPWHLSLSLAAGQISGLVISNDGKQKLLVKGGTQKIQRTQVNVDEHQVVTTKIDQFVPLIRAINVTSGEQYGSIVIIK